jgi:hypothetical protein
MRRYWVEIIWEGPEPDFDAISQHRTVLSELVSKQERVERVERDLFDVWSTFRKALQARRHAS